MNASIQFVLFCFIISQSWEAVCVAVPVCSSKDIFMLSQLKEGRTLQELVVYTITKY